MDHLLGIYLKQSHQLNFEVVIIRTLTSRALLFTKTATHVGSNHVLNSCMKFPMIISRKQAIIHLTMNVEDSRY